MNSVFRRLQVSFSQQAFVLNHTLSLCRSTLFIQPPVCDTASVNVRHYRGMPTHGIGKWRHLLRKKVQKRKKDKHHIKPLVAVPHKAYGTLNVTVSGYDMTLVEHYAQYIHNFCNHLKINVAQCYGLPTKTTEVMQLQEQGSKMYVDAILKTHLRVIQVRRLNTILCPVFIDVLLKNQPEGVLLTVKEHTEDDYKMRFKLRPEVEELLAQINRRQ